MGLITWGAIDTGLWIALQESTVADVPWLICEEARTWLRRFRRA